MAPPTTTLWTPDPHTKAKHQMLSGYLAAWFPIVARGFPTKGVTYVDAFAGPGEYEDGSVGSPIIALKHAVRPEVAGSCVRVRTVFVERDEARFEHLRKAINSRFPPKDRPKNLTIRSVNGACEDELLPVLTEVGGWGSPMFANFDGWGVDTPYALVRAVGTRESAEVLVTVNTQWFVRFATSDTTDAGDLVFGTRDWRPVAAAGSPQEKKRGLVDLYRERLRAAGFPFTLIFELIDENSHDLLLIFGTKNLKGVEKMKESMWKVDPSLGQRFRDPRDVNQLAMDFGNDPDLVLLKQQICGFLMHGPQSLTMLKNLVLLDTVFKPTHAVTAVRALDDAGDVSVKWARRHEDTIVELAAPRLF